METVLLTSCGHLPAPGHSLRIPFVSRRNPGVVYDLVWVLPSCFATSLSISVPTQKSLHPHTHLGISRTNLQPFGQALAGFSSIWASSVPGRLAAHTWMGPRDFGTPGRNRGGPDIALRVGLERAVVWDMLDLRNLMEIPRRGQQMAGDPGHEFWMGGRNKLCHFPGGRHTAPRTSRLTCVLSHWPVNGDLPQRHVTHNMPFSRCLLVLPKVPGMAVPGIRRAMVVRPGEQRRWLLS